MIRYVTAIWSFRHFWMSLVRLDLRNRYRRSVLGIGWSLPPPGDDGRVLSCLQQSSGNQG